MEMGTIMEVVETDAEGMKAVLNPEWEVGSTAAAEILTAVMETLSEIPNLNPLEFQKALMQAMSGS